MPDLLTLLVSVIILLLVLWLVQLLIGASRIPQPIGTIILVVVLIIGILWIANRAGLLP